MVADLEIKKHIFMKTLIIPDLHGKSNWKLMIYQENPDRVVFLGDYFDCYGEFSAAEQIYNFKEIVEYKKSDKAEVIMLIGNHDHHYFPEIGYTGTSGYQKGAVKYELERCIDENREHLQIAYEFDKFLCTHAGVSCEFMDQIFGKDGWNLDKVADELNELFKYKPLAFEFNGIDGYGDDTYQTPIWIRPKSLMAANKKHPIKKEYIQIVGHTKILRIDSGKSTGGRYYFVDSLDTNQEYLVIENKEVKIKQ